MQNINEKDTLYAKPAGQITDFIFDERVADVFDDMIRRSVPGYSAIINMTGVLAQEYAKANSTCYDLGCSLGAVTLAMRDRIERTDCRIVAVDNSEAMVERCRKNVKKISAETMVDVVCADIQDVHIERASVVVLNFTLQFIDPEKRRDLLKTIYDGMLSGGILIISDKIAFEDEEQERMQTQLHHNFKKLNGYSDLEIAQKRTALEKVLIPDTLQAHQDRLQSVGFSNFHVWFQCFNFASLLVFK